MQTIRKHASLLSVNKVLSVLIIAALLLAVFPAGEAARAACTRSHTVASGDTLSSIAAKYGTTVDALKTENNLSDANQISVGQVLCLPAGASGAATSTPAAGDKKSTKRSFTVTRYSTYVVLTIENYPKRNSYFVNLFDEIRYDLKGYRMRLGRVITNKSGDLEVLYKLPKSVRNEEILYICLKNVRNDDVACELAYWAE